MGPWGPGRPRGGPDDDGGPSGDEEASRDAAAGELAVQVAVILSRLGEVAEPILEAAEGYRAKLCGLGYPADVAASMAGDYHRWLLDNLSPRRGGADDA